MYLPIQHSFPIVLLLFSVCVVRSASLLSLAPAVVSVSGQLPVRKSIKKHCSTRFLIFPVAPAVGIPSDIRSREDAEESDGRAAVTNI
jgi:hypothetical protein